MRKTLHDYVIEQYNTSQDNSIDRLANFSRCFRYAKLTNRPPKLGDFIPCDEDGNVLEEPKNFEQWTRKELNVSYYIDSNNYVQYQAAKDRVIFKGDWGVEPLLGGSVDIFNKEQDWKVRFDEYGDVIVIAYGKYPYIITRIEDLPREIEFKDNLI
jgi:hypothetical protein